MSGGIATSPQGTLLVELQLTSRRAYVCLVYCIWYGIVSYKSDTGVGSSSTEISEMEEFLKLISESIEVSPLVALLGLGISELKLELRQSRLEILRPLPHDKIRERTNKGRECRSCSTGRALSTSCFVSSVAY
ncbi:hypothetical protein L211DRAFT_346697 [Terfezia boudieri ATCC MYA-4762]|uniref:Uncharacterized protein n=1 Tax=Terfezia boudieri ATCC MYA-4762 TaxID=1051890 RepID=A0A3N4LHB6_9PEZI|nr:hypothetical protein L211DRAFT_346697 [Terfezia boudieri ATCC MYA-4762]